MTITRRSIAAATMALSCAFGPLTLPAAHASDRSKLTSRGLEALHELEASDKRAHYLAGHARAILIFPSVLKAGFVFGGETGNGVLLENEKPAGFYNLSGGSWGLQLGGQDFAYAIFFMTDGSLRYLHRSAGWAIGTGPSITVVNASAAADADTTTLTHDVYAFPFNGKGLMADLTLQGTKITRIHPR